jgi:hypothetical protein
MSAVDMDRLHRDAQTRLFFAGNDRPKPALFIRSNWTVSIHQQSRELRGRLTEFAAELQTHFRSTKCGSNLLPQQEAALAFIRDHPNMKVWKTEKNLGPIVTTMTLYLERAWKDHLRDNSIYRQLSAEQCRNRVNCVKRQYKLFLEEFFKGEEKKDDRTFLERSLEQNEDKLPYFYIIAKIHKSPWTTRPIISTCGSYVEGIGRWTDRQLQAIIKQLPFVAKSSTDVLKELLALPPLPEGARLFTADAQSMYTNIDTKHAIDSIMAFLYANPDMCRIAKVEPKSILLALRILMIHNVFTFGDTYWVQQTGTAMGTAAGPAYATLYFAVHEPTLACPELRFLYAIHRRRSRHLGSR